MVVNMNTKINYWLSWIYSMTKEFMDETSNKKYEIVDDYTCESTGKKMVVIKMSQRHTNDCSLDEAILSDKYIDGFDARTIRALSCAAIAEKMTPEFRVVSEKEVTEKDDHVFDFKSKNGQFTSKFSSETCTDREFISKLSSLDAHKIGYIAGINEAVKEFQAIRALDKEKEEISNK